MDFPEVLALVAPRPLMILGGRKDPIFPPDGFRAAFRKASRIYELFEAPGQSERRIRLVESGQGHTDPPHSLCETRRWMCRWLRNPAGIPFANADASPPPESPATLRCLESVPCSVRNYRIHDEWVVRPNGAVPASPEAAAQRKEELLARLRTGVFGWFPTAPIPFKTRRLVASGGYAGAFADFGEYEFDSEPGIPVKVCLLKPQGKTGPIPLVLWVKAPTDSVVFPDVDEFFPLLRSHALLIVTPRFAERPLAPRAQAGLERTAALTGRSVAALRTWDVLRSVAWATRDGGIEPSEIAVYGRGDAGIEGLYAALFDSSIGHVILRDPPFSHLAGPALPGILRETDIEEVAGLLAPRRLTLLSHRKEGWNITGALFGLSGAPNAFRRAASLPEAVLKRPTDREEVNRVGEGPC